MIHAISVTTTQICHCNIKAAADNTFKKWECLCFNTDLCMKVDGRTGVVHGPSFANSDLEARRQVTEVGISVTLHKKMFPGLGENDKGRKITHRVVKLQLIFKCYPWYIS